MDRVKGRMSWLLVTDGVGKSRNRGVTCGGKEHVDLLKRVNASNSAGREYEVDESTRASA